PIQHPVVNNDRGPDVFDEIHTSSAEHPGGERSSRLATLIVARQFPHHKVGITEPRQDPHPRTRRSARHCRRKLAASAEMSSMCPMGTRAPLTACRNRSAVSRIHFDRLPNVLASSGSSRLWSPTRNDRNNQYSASGTVWGRSSASSNAPSGVVSSSS